MKAVIVTLAASLLSGAAAAPQDLCDTHVKRSGSQLTLGGKPWKPVGGNTYWLGLDENVIPPKGQPFYAPFNASYPTKGRITEAMAMIKALGGTILRTHTLGVSLGNPLSARPAEDQVNEAAFDSIDWALHQAREYGVRLLVPLIDHYDYYHGGKFDFLRWHGYNLTGANDLFNPETMEFYFNEAIVADFKSYIHQILTHRNRYTGLTYAEDATVFAIESGNELHGYVNGDTNCPASWVQDIAKYVKELAPEKLFVDGTYGINSTHLTIDEVDIFSDHFYPTNATKAQEGLDAVVNAGKVYFAGEYDWTKLTPNDPFYQVLENSNSTVGSAFWSLFGRNVPHCDEWVIHNDGFMLSYGNPNNSATTDSAIKLIRQHLLKMSTGVDVGPDADLPIVPCPIPANGTLSYRK